MKYWHYFNLVLSQLEKRLLRSYMFDKRIAIIASNNNISSGVYEQRAATDVARKIQEDVVSFFEKHVLKYNRIKLHCKLLSALACEMF